MSAPTFLDRLLSRPEARDLAPERTPVPTRCPGLPRFDLDRAAACAAHVSVCPSLAMTVERDPTRALLRFEANLGRCIGCGDCARVCPEGSVHMERRHDVAVRDRADLVWLGEYVDPLVSARGVVDAPEQEPRRILPRPPANLEGAAAEIRVALRQEVRRRYERSLAVHPCVLGDCGACGAEIRALEGIAFDIGRLGVRLVSAPAAADLLLVVGATTWRTLPDLNATLQAMPEPRLVVAAGACACEVGIHHACHGVAGPLHRHVPVDIRIPGCPPRPLSLLHGLLLAVGRAEQALHGETWRDPRLSG